MNVYVVVVTYNGMRWLDRCLESISSSDIRLKTILIDNMSTDGSLQYVKTKFPEVQSIEAGGNLGFGKANNLGIQIALDAGADYVFLLNQDAWIEPDTVAGLIDIHQKYSGYGILSPLHLTGAGDALDRSFSMYCSVKECPDFLSDAVLHNYRDVYSIGFVNAAFWLISRECLLKVGLFDPLFPHYGEDLDYVNRVKAFNFYIGICPRFKGFHDRENRSFSVVRDLKMKHLGKICILKDINKSFASSLAIVTFLSIKNMTKSILSRNWKSFLGELRGSFQLLGDLKKIADSRKASKLGGAYFSGN